MFQNTPWHPVLPQIVVLLFACHTWAGEEEISYCNMSPSLPNCASSCCLFIGMFLIATCSKELNVFRSKLPPVTWDFAPHHLLCPALVGSASLQLLLLLEHVHVEKHIYVYTRMSMQKKKNLFSKTEVNSGLWEKWIWIYQKEKGTAMESLIFPEIFWVFSAQFLKQKTDNLCVISL